MYATVTHEFCTLSLHDALPIFERLATGALARRLRSTTTKSVIVSDAVLDAMSPVQSPSGAVAIARRSEEHTSELQSHSDLVCRLLLEKKYYTVIVDKRDNMLKR